MAKYHRCPSCGHNPKGFSSSWMWIYRCKTCGKLFCHACSGSNGGRQCPKCKSTDRSQDAECHGT